MLFLLIGAAIILFLLSMKFWRKSISYGFSPTMIYSLVWGGIWLFHSFDFMYYRTVSDRALIYSAIPLFTIFIGEFLALSTRLRLRRKSIALNTVIFRRWIVFLGGLSLLSGAVLFLASYLQFGTFWIGDGAVALKYARVHTGLGMYTSIFSLPAKYSLLLQGANYSAAILCGLYLRLINRRYWTGLLLSSLGAILFDFSLGSRSRIYDIMLIFLITQLFLPIPLKTNIRNRINKIKKNKNKLFLVLILIVFIGIMNSIGLSTRKKDSRNIGNLEIPLSIAQFVDYNAGNLISFDQRIDDTPLTWGRLSFWGVEQIARLLRIIPSSFEVPKQLVEWEIDQVRLQPDFRYKRSLNTYSWLRYLYSDFGIVGLLLIPFVIGFLTTKSAMRWIKYRQLPSLSMLAISYLILLRSPTIMMFRTEVFVIGVIMLYYASAKIVVKYKIKKVSNHEQGIYTQDVGR